jgi:succinate dehydrogenase/fumarate reductase flavoprotein subunit
LELITEHHIGRKVTRYDDDIHCYGAYVFDTRSDKVEPVLAKATLIATGGLGEVYLHSTNPSIATGDGIAMAYRAKARVANMEFMQFHPTTLNIQKPTPSSFPKLCVGRVAFSGIATDMHSWQNMTNAPNWLQGISWPVLLTTI